MKRPTDIPEAKDTEGVLGTIHRRGQIMVWLGLVGVILGALAIWAYDLRHPQDDVTFGIVIAVACVTISLLATLCVALGDARLYFRERGGVLLAIGLTLSGSAAGIVVLVLLFLVFMALMSITLGFALPLAIVVAMAPPVVSLAVPLLLSAGLPSLEQRRRARGECAACGYPFGQAERCPECGSPRPDAQVFP